MAKKQGGMNTKVEGANAKNAAAKASKDAAKAAAAAAAKSAEWSKGADARGDRRRQEEVRKRAEAEAKKVEKQKLLALEEHALDEDKHVIRKQKKASNRGSKKPSAFAAGPSGGKLTQADMAALREAEEARTAAKPGRKAIKFDNNFQANKNRNQDEDSEARSLDAALDLLTLREDYPGLKLSQYKQKLSELWRRSPDNSLN
ncbi:hypothetical protein PF002_g9591 [Phytophthora fragariae]|uniref:Uncharacterized protein n=1 Tax=Phytophthora fragariae TaxID=53985 RepID=A0A6A3S9Y7_9STRA|nr:hypothetical protein PF007_g10921 [Phytophthora fragariae]KAE9240791.1 hypothetical protein PF002_g9591 [Phytophthora fragariae]